MKKRLPQSVVGCAALAIATQALSSWTPEAADELAPVLDQRRGGILASEVTQENVPLVVHEDACVRSHSVPRAALANGTGTIARVVVADVGASGAE